MLGTVMSGQIPYGVPKIATPSRGDRSQSGSGIRESLARVRLNPESSYLVRPAARSLSQRRRRLLSHHLLTTQNAEFASRGGPAGGLQQMVIGGRTAWRSAGGPSHWLTEVALNSMRCPAHGSGSLGRRLQRPGAQTSTRGRADAGGAERNKEASMSSSPRLE